MAELKGRRLEDGRYPETPGDYAKFPQSDGEAWWCVKAPSGGPSFFLCRPTTDGSARHWVRENEDGTITVEPNPPDAPPERRNSNSILWNGWHGWIYDGVWRDG